MPGIWVMRSAAKTVHFQNIVNEALLQAEEVTNFVDFDAVLVKHVGNASLDIIGDGME